MIKKIKQYVPQTRKKWILYSRIFFPLILSATFFAFNGIVDNFMVGGIEKGQAALSVANSWTNILQSWFIACGIASIPIMNQFYRVNKQKQTINSIKYQYVLCAIPSLLLFAISWMNPNILIKCFYHGNDKEMINNIISYMHVISIRWIIMIVTFNIGSSLNALGFGFKNMIINILVILTNVSLNSLLMYYFGFGISGAAWASNASSVVSMCLFAIIIYKNKIKVVFNPFKLLAYGSIARKMFWRRWLVVSASFIQSLFIIWRTSLYDYGYPDNSIAVGVNGLSVVALTGALMNLFTTGYSALGTMAVTFVGTELAKGDMEAAKYEANQVRGFSFIVAFFTSILLALFSLLIPSMHFLSHNHYEVVNGIKQITFDGDANLDQVFKSVLIMGIFYPWWLLMAGDASIANSGGKGWRIGLANFVSQGLVLAWLAVIVFAIIPCSTLVSKNLWLMYMILYAGEMLKLGVYEWLYRKYDWLHSLVKEEENDVYKLKKLNSK